MVELSSKGRSSGRGMLLLLLLLLLLFDGWGERGERERPRSELGLLVFF